MNYTNCPYGGSNFPMDWDIQLSSINLTFKHNSDAWATTTLRLTTGSFPQVPSTLFPGQSVWWICHWMRSCPRCGETRDRLEEWCTNTRLQLLLVWLSGQAFVKVLKVDIHHFTFHWISIFHFDLSIYMVILMGLWTTWFEGGQVIWNEIISFDSICISWLHPLESPAASTLTETWLERHHWIFNQQTLWCTRSYEILRTRCASMWFGSFGKFICSLEITARWVCFYGACTCMLERCKKWVPVGLGALYICIRLQLRFDCGQGARQRYHTYRNACQMPGTNSMVCAEKSDTLCVGSCFGIEGQLDLLG